MVESEKAVGTLILPPRFEVENFDFNASHSSLVSGSCS